MERITSTAIHIAVSVALLISMPALAQPPADQDFESVTTGAQGPVASSNSVTIDGVTYAANYANNDQIFIHPSDIGVFLSPNFLSFASAVGEANEVVISSASGAEFALDGIDLSFANCGLNGFCSGIYQLRPFRDGALISGGAALVGWDGDGPVLNFDGTSRPAFRNIDEIRILRATVGTAYIAIDNLVFSPAELTVGGQVTGLLNSETVTLQNNAGDDLVVSADGPFTFATSLTTGDAYAVTVLTQPGPISETCTVTNGSGTLGNENITNVNVTCSINNFTVGGSVSGLAAGQSVELLNLGGDALTVSTDGPFTFSPQADGTAYAVTVGTQPSGQFCSVTNGSGTLPGGSNVINVAVNCVATTVQVGGLVTGLVTGEFVVLQNNGGDDLPVLADGSFTFPSAATVGASYAVTVLKQPGPVTETCTVSNGNGTAGSTDITNVIVACALNTFTVGGSVTGLPSGTDITLLNQGADAQTVAGSGAFTFSPQADGSAYAVTVSAQPAGFSCAVTNGSGTLPGGTNVSNVAVACSVIEPPKPIPTLPVWMLALLSALIAGLGIAANRRHR